MRGSACSKRAGRVGYVSQLGCREGPLPVLDEAAAAAGPDASATGATLQQPPGPSNAARLVNRAELDPPQIGTVLGVAHHGDQGFGQMRRGHCDIRHDESDQLSRPQHTEEPDAQQKGSGPEPVPQPAIAAGRQHQLQAHAPQRIYR